MALEKYTKKKLVLLFFQFAAMAVLISVDLLIKSIVMKIPLHSDVAFWKGVIGWTYEQNTGIAWSMFDGNPRLLSLITGILLAAGAVYIILPLKRPKAYDICIPIIIAGGTANLIDRVMHGFVVDYIKTLYIDFPVYNFADCLVTCGGAAFVIYLIYEVVRDSRREKKAAAENGNE